MEITRMLLGIGGLVVELATEGPAAAGKLALGTLPSYELADTEAKVDIRLQLLSAPAPLSLADAESVQVTVSTRADGVVTLEAQTFSGSLWWEAQTLCGQVTVREPRFGPWSVLRYALAMALPPRGRLLLHASAVARAGGLWIFAGAVGAGKSTIATELAGAGRPFSLDRTIVAPGEAAGFDGFPSPFSDFDGLTQARAPLPVCGVVFIEQADRDALEALDPSAALRHLLRRVMLVDRSPAAIGRVMTLADRLATARLCYRLRFTRSERFWHLLRGVPHAPAGRAAGGP